MSKIKKKVVITGTFDVLHPGHIYLINEAAKLGEVYVIVARDANVKKFKGTYPTVSEDQRLEMVQSLKNVNKAVLGKQDSDYFIIIEEINPDIILLGPNQKISIAMVKERLKEKGLEHVEVIRLEKLYNKYKLHSSSLIKQKIIKNSSKNGTEGK